MASYAYLDYPTLKASEWLRADQGSGPQQNAQLQVFRRCRSRELVSSYMSALTTTVVDKDLFEVQLQRRSPTRWLAYIDMLSADFSALPTFDHH